MSDELDAFLRQAAERRKARQQEKASRPPINQSGMPSTQLPPNAGGRAGAGSDRRSPPPLQPGDIAPSVRRLQTDSTSDNVYERAANKTNSRSAGNSPPRSPYTSQSEPEQYGRLQSQFDRENEALLPTANISRPPKRKQPPEPARKIGDTGPLTNRLAAPLSSQISLTDNANVQEQDPRPLNQQTIAEQLRNPNALPLGTILVLGEVLKRPWE